MERNGTYPAPPFWPEKLATNGRPLHPHPLNPLLESEAVQHDYIADGWPGPCSISFRDGEFWTWMPAITVERAEGYALRA